MRILLSLISFFLLAMPAQAQMHEVGSHAEKLSGLDWMHGTWRGTATTMTQSGQRITSTQTERVSPMLSGDVLVVEGRSDDAEGNTVFNALAMISYDARTDGFTMRTSAMGRTGQFPLKITDDGFIWQLPAGPNAIVQYKAVYDGETWSQTGQYIRDGAEPVDTFSMELQRLGDTDWPAAGAVPMD